MAAVPAKMRAIFPAHRLANCFPAVVPDSFSAKAKQVFQKVLKVDCLERARILSVENIDHQ